MNEITTYPVPCECGQTKWETVEMTESKLVPTKSKFSKWERQIKSIKSKCSHCGAKVDTTETNV